MIDLSFQIIQIWFRLAEGNSFWASQDAELDKKSLQQHASIRHRKWNIG